ncbi:hypothetical protein Tco_1367619 [Tanacetum coccineum]
MSDLIVLFAAIARSTPPRNGRASNLEATLKIQQEPKEEKKSVCVIKHIPRFQQRFDETFYEAWDRFNDLLRACPHHGFSELHQLDTFYNALNSNDQDSLNSAAGGNFLDKIPRDCLRIIESKSKVRNSRNKPVFAKVSARSSTPGISPDVAEIKDMVKALLLDKKKPIQAPPPVNAVRGEIVWSPLIMRIDMSGETKSTSMDMACEEVIKKFSASPDVDRGMAFPLLSMTDRCAFCYGPSLLRDSGFFLLEEAYAYPRS